MSASTHDPEQIYDDHLTVLRARETAINAIKTYEDVKNLLGVDDGDLAPAPEEFTESPFVASLLRGVQKAGYPSFVVPSDDARGQFAKACRLVGAWLTRDVHELEEADAELLPKTLPLGPDAGDKANVRAHDTSVFLSFQGSLLRQHPTPRGWLVANLLDAVGDAVGDYYTPEPGVTPCPAEANPESHANILAIVIYAATQLALHEVGSEHLRVQLANVEANFGARGGTHFVELYKVMHPRLGAEAVSAIDQLREAGLLQVPLAKET